MDDFQKPPTIIMKYFEPLDCFLRIRVFTREKIQGLLRNCSVSDKTAYLELVIRSCIVGFADQIQLYIREQFGPEYYGDIKIGLYQACMDVNPRLEIHQVSIPIVDPNDHDSDQASSPAQSGQEQAMAGLYQPSVPTKLESLPRLIAGQEKAIDAVSRALRLAHLRLNNPLRPCACLLFVGPTGVGKTELACCLSRNVLQEKRLARVDCTEYAMPHEYAKLLGAPPGFVGHDEDGLLVSVIEEEPNRVVLFDEIEKADERLHNLLLQILDTGHFTSGKGKLIDMTGCFIILTSNTGTTELARAETAIGFRHTTSTVDQAQRESIVRRAIEREFQPEFLNRLDQVIVFESLSEKEVEKIARLHVRTFVKRLEKRQGIKLRVTQAVIKLLAREAFNPIYGAREVHRVVRRHLIDYVASEIMAGKLKEGQIGRIMIRRGEIILEGGPDHG